jgi:hypothetical protein
MYLQKVISIEKKIIIFVGVLKVTGEKSRIRSRKRYGSEYHPDPYQNVTARNTVN